MMYASFRKKDRLAIKTSLIAGWFFIAFGALGGIWLPPVTIAKELGTLSTVGSWVALIFAISAMTGVFFNRYWIEWVAAWFVGMGLSTYAVTVWVLVFQGTPTRLQQAGYVTALILFVVVRIAFNAAHAAKQRQIHEHTEEIQKKLNDEG